MKPTKIKDVLLSALDWHARMGVDVNIPVVKNLKPNKTKSIRSDRSVNSDQKPAPSVKAAHAANPKIAQSGPTVETIQTLAEKTQTLGELRTAMESLHIGEISDHARQIVFARGTPEAKIMVIGEAPGRDEDIAGQPFVGPSGQLLDRIFATIGLDESQIYITNIVNWHPPGNRKPTPEEIALCRPLLQRHMELVNPKILVLIGGVSFSALTGKNGIMKNRGQWTELRIGDKLVPTLPTYHPAFLLRQPALKKQSWHDMLALKDKMNTLEI